MRAVHAVERLPEFVPAFLEISELKDPVAIRVLGHLHKPGEADFEDSLAKLRELPEFERTPESRVIPIDRLNAAPRNFANYHIMDVHGAIRQSLSHGMGGMVEIGRSRDELDVLDKLRAGRAIKEFGGFAVIRATQLSQTGWRRGGGYSDSDGEGKYIATHYRSYEILRPFMSRTFRRLVEEAAVNHQWLTDLSQPAAALEPWQSGDLLQETT
jgi:hypothetical protein